MELKDLDIKDRKILAILDWNARIPTSEIAKKVQLSKPSVQYRINQLEKAGVIRGYYPVINFLKLGMNIGRVSLKFQNITPAVRSNIEKYVQHKKHIYWGTWCRGAIDLGIGIGSKNSLDFKKNFNHFNKRFGKYIQERSFTTSTGFIQVPYRFILNNSSSEKMEVLFTSEPFYLDILDFAILKIINQDARQNASEIAQAVNSNYKTVLYRMRKLQENGILIGFRAAIDHRFFNLEYYKVLFYFNYYSDEIYEKLKKFICSYKQMIYFVYHVNSDLDAEFLFNSDDEFYTLLDAINEQFPGLIKRYSITILIDNFKINYLPYLDEYIKR